MNEKISIKHEGRTGGTDWKLLFLKTIVVSLFLFLAGRLFYLQIVRGDYFQEQAELNMTRELLVPAPRGPVFDRKGRLMASNRPLFEVKVLPGQVENLNRLVHALSSLLNLDPVKLKKILMEYSQSSYEPVTVMENLDPAAVARVSEIIPDLPGVYLSAFPLRKYPDLTLAAHVLGYVGEITAEELKARSADGYRPGDLMGKVGIEREYDLQLKGKPGRRLFQVDVSGKVTKLLREEGSVPGDSIYLTLDKKAQRAAETSLLKTIEIISKKNDQPCAGSVVAVDPSNGRVLAMANYPTFDPNLFAEGITSGQYEALLSDRLRPMLDRAIACTFPCGSTFKMITGSAALQENICRPDSVFDCTGVFYLGREPFNCFERSGHGRLNFIDAIAVSCDVVFYRLGHALGLARLRRYASSFGIGALTGIDLPGESPGLLPDEKWKMENYGEPWYSGDTVNLSIGQGFLGTTPLQMAMVTSAVANGGTLYRPALLLRMESPEGKVLYDFKPAVIGKTAAGDEKLALIRRGMRAAVLRGTAVSADSPLVEIAGKTGTAENVPTHDNPLGRNHAWFVSFAPWKKPAIAVCVFLEQSGGFGGQWAAPIARKVIETYLDEEKPR
jgi:penicillin-binding protein 2